MSFDPNQPLEAAQTPPADWYTEASFLTREKENIFKKNWLFAGRIDQVQNPGEYLSGDFLGLPYLVLRDQDGQLRAFYNVCRHHATCLVSGSGKARQLVCPYHGWTYELDGALRKAPRMSGAVNFEAKDWSLKPIHVQEWGPWIWIHFGEKKSPFKSKAVLPRLVDAGIDGLQFFKRIQYEIHCNWKVYIDNYLDGGYHVPHLHRGLAKDLDLGSYRNEVEEDFSIQFCKAKGTERLGSEALYAWLYPNFMVNRYGEMMDTNWVIPLSENRTLTIFDYFATPEFLRKNQDSFLTASDQVQKEDIDICERVQRGLESGAFSVGRYSPEVEGTAFAFHRRISQDLLPT